MAETVNFELAHVLFMDVVGYSQLLIDDQREVLRELNALVRGTKQFRAAEAENKVVCLPTGDGMVLAFSTAPDTAARCAIELARAIRARPGIKLRMGIHCGPVSTMRDVNEHANVAGGGINLAQRVMDCGDAGHILLSQRVAEDLAQFREWNAAVHDLGETTVKHGTVLHLYNFFGEDFGNAAPPAKFRGKIRRGPGALVKAGRWRFPVAIGLLLLLAAAATILWPRLFRSRPSGGAEKSGDIPAKSIAVLPFENLSEDKNNSYFADGIQDEILTRLAHVADLKVISRTSTSRFKSKSGDVAEIARQLGVAHILEGSAQRSENQVRVNVQLIQAATDTHLWAETFDRKLTDVFTVETEIATRIADELRVKLTGAEHVAMGAKPTENMEAHELFLRGRFTMTSRKAPDLERAIGYFQEALAKDANYAAAYASIANCYLLLREYSNRSAEDLFPKARDAVRRALALDENMAEAHSSLAFLLVTADRNFPESVSEFERAIALNPNAVDAHYFFGISVLTPLGQFDRALAEIRHAIALDPFSAIINANLGYALIQARRYPEAIAQLRRTLEIDPNFPYTHGCLGQVLFLNGQKEAAIAEYGKAQGVARSFHPDVFLAWVYASAGEREKAMQLLTQVKEKEQKLGEIWAYGYAVIQLALGDKEGAIDWLEKSFQTQETGIIPYIKVDPLLDPLRGNPRFEQLADQVVPKNSG